MARDLLVVGSDYVVPVAIVASFVLWQLLRSMRNCIRRRRFNTSVRGAHVVITGGSQGLGKDLAGEFYRRGALVTLVARKRALLDEARALIETIDTAAAVRGRVGVESADGADCCPVDSAACCCCCVVTQWLCCFGFDPWHKLLLLSSQSRTGTRCVPPWSGRRRPLAPCPS